MDRAAGTAAELATPLSSTALARQRTLPVADPLRSLLPGGALARGRTVACRGPAATSLAVALAAAATDAGAWLAVVDVPWLGVEAVAELGVPLERLVRIDPGSCSSGTAWAELVAAVLDGFELVVTRVPRRLNGGVLRRVLARVQAREGVLIAVGEPDVLTPDVTLDAAAPVWEGVGGDGAGCLRARRVTVTAAGRRIPGARRTELWLPGPGGGVAAAAEPRLRSVG